MSSEKEEDQKPRSPAVLEPFAHKEPGFWQQFGYPNTSGLEPAGIAVLVEPYEPEKLSSIIEIPDTARAGLRMVEQRAVVIAVGPSAWHDEPYPRVVPGDHCLIAKYSGFQASADITADGKSYRLCNDREVFCKIKKPELRTIEVKQLEVKNG